MSDLVTTQNSLYVLTPAHGSEILLPAVIAEAGGDTARRFVEFFLVNIRNKNTRTAYAQAIKQFLDWCDLRGLKLGHGKDSDQNGSLDLKRLRGNDLSVRLK